MLIYFQDNLLIKMNVLDIADDCVKQIFIKMSILELSQVAKTSARFRWIAREVFTAHHMRSSVKLPLGLSPVKSNTTFTANQITDILHIFGDMLTNVVIIFCSDAYINTYVFNLMIIYCTHNLEAITIRDCNKLCLDGIINGKSLFQNAKIVTFDRSIALSSAFLSNAQKLKELCLLCLNPKQLCPFLVNHYPKLISLNIQNVPSCLDAPSINLNQFTLRHPNLVQLRIDRYTLNRSNSFQNMPKLKRLFILDCEYYARNMINLDKLTTLQIKSTTDSIIQVLNHSKSQNSLSELSIIASIIEDPLIMIALPRFQNLTSLVIKCWFDIGDKLLAHLHALKKLRMLVISSKLSITTIGVLKLLQKLHQLSAFALDSFGANKRIELYETTYLKICDIYRNRCRQLLMYNYDVTNETDYNKIGYNEIKRIKPFAGSLEERHVLFYTIIPDTYCESKFLI